MDVPFGQSRFLSQPETIQAPLSATRTFPRARLDRKGPGPRDGNPPRLGSHWWQQWTEPAEQMLETPLAPPPTQGMEKKAVPGRVPRDANPGQHRPPCKT